MNTVTISDIKRHGSRSLSDTETKILIVNSKPKSAIIPIEEYHMMINSLEDIEDAKDITKRQNEPTLNQEDFFKKALK